jgi:hypothetical protein
MSVPCHAIQRPFVSSISSSLQLDIIVQQPDLLAGLEGRQPNVRTAVAAEGVAEGAVAAAADLALDGEVDLVEQVVGAELHRVERGVGGGPLRGVFGFQLLLHAAGAVFARAAPLAGLRGALWGWKGRC